MKKLYIILALLLFQLSSMQAQMQAIIQLPFVSHLTLDPGFYGDEFYDMPVRMAAGGHVSIVAVPYQGIASGNESTIMSNINSQLSTQLGSHVECIEITGIDLSNPLLSKGLMYFQFLPNIQSGLNIIELRVNQETETTLLIQLPQGMAHPEMIKYGLDYYTSGTSVLFSITGPELSSGTTLTIRKITQGQTADTWPIISTFSSSNTAFDPSSLPSTVISVSSSLLTEGSYAIYNDTYGVIASNAVSFAPLPLPEYEWLKMSGESSTQRTYTLNKNGETYTTTAYVPIDSDISILRSILNGSTYSSGPILFSLINEVLRENDIALTFEVKCEPNTGNTQRVLETGFSDRILPNIPNRFIQPIGGAYETTVEIGIESVTIHYSKIGTTYWLMDEYGYSLIDQKNGNGGDLVFSPPAGIYSLMEYKGSTYTLICKKFNLNFPISFLLYPHLVYESSMIELGPGDNSLLIETQKEIDFNISTLREAATIASGIMGIGRIVYEYVEMNKDSCTLRIAAPINNSNSDCIFTSFLLFGQTGQNIQIKVKPGGSVQAFNIAGSWNDTAHTSFNVTLDGSQNGVGYSLMMVNEYPNMPVENTIVANKIGTGDPIVFENITQKGVYKVVVYKTDDTYVEMQGIANMYNSSEVVNANTNYIRTKLYTNAKGTKYNESAVHYDGLGRDIQVVNVGAGGNGNDIIQIIEYDNMGRNDTKSYMPYTRPNISYEMSASGLTEQSGYYQNKFTGDADSYYPYGQKRYEYTATTDKVVQSTPGQNTYMYEHPFHTLVRAVRTDESIKKLAIAGDNRSLRYVGTYASGALVVKESWQEMGSGGTNIVSTEYSDPQGRLVAKRVKVSTSDIRTTYYVYDDMGNQRYIIPPTEELSGVGTYTPEQLRKYCFYTEFDKYGNAIAQFIPGAEPVYSLYDRRNRLVMSQSGNQRADGKNEWSYLKYDALDRPVYNGTYVGGTLESHKSAIAAAGNSIHEKRGGNIHGYTCNSYPTNIDPNKVLSVTYYDDYSWFTDSQYNFSTDDKLSADPSLEVEGLATGNKTKVLGIDTNQWLTTVTYYDKDYQTIQSIADLYPQGVEIVSNTHDFSGAVTRTKVKQVINSKTYEYNKWFTHDDQGRLLHIDQQITSDTGNGKVRLVSYEYDDMNQTAAKSIHNAKEKTIYNYRMTGQLSSEVSPSFSYSLGFDRPANAGLDSRADGKLASIAWGTGDNLNKAYNFTYDGVGQMLSANYAQKSGSAWSGQTKFAEKDITYDKNGNILGLSRTAELTAGNQNIVYYYEDANKGNVLTGVTVNGGSKMTFGYDADGNLVDDMMSMVTLSYNEVGLPEKIQAKFGSTDAVRYIYSASGEKLATVAPNGSLTYYRSVFTYAKTEGASAEELQYVLHPEGIIQKENNSWTYKYFKKDHIGSTRVLLAARDSNLVVEQSTDYYPYGLSHGSLNNLQLNRYLYGGKEYQDAMINGSPLGLYDFHARYYNPVLGRWFNVDPALQTTNPYIYCGNSPMMYIDPDGEFVHLIIGAVIGGVLNAAVAAFTGGDIARAFCIGAVSGALGGVASFGMGSLLTSGGSGFVGGAITGAAGGFAGGASNAWMNGAGFGKGLVSGLMGAGSGALMGGLMRGISDSRKGFNFWEGSKITGEATIASNSSGQSYDKATLKAMARQAKADAKSLWGAENGKNGLKDISTRLDAAARRAGISNVDGNFVNSEGRAIGGFTKGFSSGNSKIYLSPNVASSRTMGILSSYSVTSSYLNGSVRTFLSTNYVGVLGHELIHVENWFYGGYQMPWDTYVKYSENAAYEFSKHVSRMNVNAVNFYDGIMKANDWTTPHPTFRKTSIFTY